MIAHEMRLSTFTLVAVCVAESKNRSPTMTSGGRVSGVNALCDNTLGNCGRANERATETPRRRDAPRLFSPPRILVASALLFIACILMQIINLTKKIIKCISSQNNLLSRQLQLVI